jgi:membrane-associated phospholipid phosphatase
VTGSALSRAAAAGIVVAALVTAQTCPAEELEWRPPWRRVGPAEYLVTGGAVSTYVLTRFVAPKTYDASWRDPILFDAPVRNAFQLGNPTAREYADTSADILINVLLLQSLAVDPWLVAALGRGSPDVGWQLFVISAQSHALAMLLNSATKLVIARQRPYWDGCDEEATYHESCDGAARYRSFYSSHSSIAATSAGLICAHHTNVAIYGSAAADIVACASAGVAAAAVGVLRVAAQEHWASDVVVGQLIGFSIGYFVPTLVYYREPTQTEASNGTSGGLRMMFAPGPGSITLGGSF